MTPNRPEKGPLFTRRQGVPCSAAADNVSGPQVSATVHISVRDHDSAASGIWGHRYISAAGKPADTGPETKEDQPHTEVKRHQNVKAQFVKLRSDTYRTGLAASLSATLLSRGAALTQSPETRTQL